MMMVPIMMMMVVTMAHPHHDFDSQTHLQRDLNQWSERYRSHGVPEGPGRALA
jgi:hypothetical protein